MPRLASWIGLLLLAIWNAAAASPQTALQRIEAPRLVVQTGHSTGPSALAFSPDGRVLATGGYDKAIKLWEVAGGKELRTLGGHTNEVRCLTFSPDGRTLASGGEDNTLLFHDAATGRETGRLALSGNVLALDYAPDGKLLAIADRTGTITLYDTSAAQVVREIKAHPGAIPALAFSADGRTLVSATLGDQVKVWNVADGELRASYLAKAEGVTAVVRLPGEDRFALAGRDGKLRIWAVNAGRQLAEWLAHDGPVTSLAATADGKVLTSVGTDKSLKQWDAASGELLASTEVKGYRMDDPRYRVLGYFSPDHFAVAPDGKVAAWGGEEEKIELLDRGTQRFLNGEADEILALQFLDTALFAQINSATAGAAIWSQVSGRMIRRMQADRLPLRDEDSRMTVTRLPGEEGRLILLTWEGSGFGGGGGGDVAIWDDPGQVVGKLPVQCVSEAVLSPDGRLAATTGVCARMLAVRDKDDLSNEANEDQGTLLALDDRKVAVLEKERSHPRERRGVALWDVARRRVLHQLKTVQHSAEAMAFSPDGKSLVASEINGTLRLWRTRTGKLAWKVRLDDTGNGSDWAPALAYAPDGATIAVGLRDSMNIELRSAADGKRMATLSGHDGALRALVYSPDGRFLVSAAEDMTLRYWRLSDGAHVATLYSFADGSWVVTDPDGRFDASSLDEIRGLHWVMPDDPYTPVALEAFMKDYYEPRLLPRILEGEVFKPVRALAELNRVQPAVRIVGVAPDAHEPGRVQVEVEVSAASREYLRDGQSVTVATAAHDLMLFRDGQLVGHLDGLVAAPGEPPRRQTFVVRLPSSGSAPDLERNIAFSAYAFNDDRIKSATAHADYRNAATASARERRAYVIAFGVNDHDNPAWDLDFAANDARLFRNTLAERLESTGQFREVVSLELVSEGTERRADKELLHAVLDRLAGKPSSPLLAGLPGAEHLQAARPDDLVLLTFSGHGHADGGNYYLLTQNTGAAPAATPSQGRRIDAALLANSISSEELAQWLRDVDAGDMTLVVDACQSAASVQGEGFKPGPMGSRGLGQLAFDKGMRILAASQADEFALENERLRHGLLSHALLVEGLAGFRADSDPKDGKIMLDEWLSYGVKRVPALAGDIRSGHFELASKGLVRTLPQARVRPIQQPALFDFAKRRAPVELAAQGRK